MNTLGLIILISAILMLIIPIIVTIVLHDSEWIILSVVSILLFMLFGLVNYPDPKDKDIKEGKAIYVEDKHIEVTTQGDTLNVYNTYHKEWLPEWKYGRKQYINK